MPKTRDNNVAIKQIVICMICTEERNTTQQLTGAKAPNINQNN